MNRILVVAPHPLDEALGCGGTMARHAAAGDAVDVLILCAASGARGAALEAAACGAAGLFGANPPRFAGFPENRTDTVPLAEIVATVEAALRETQADTVYVSHGGNLNVDHRSAYMATVTACRPAPGGAVRELRAYEIASSTDWAPARADTAFLPTIYVDIAAHLDAKRRALELYGPEMRAEPHARSVAGLERIARVRGASVGLAAAEAFALVRAIHR